MPLTTTHTEVYMLTVTLTPNRDDRDRYVSLVKYEMDASGKVVPYRWTYEVIGGVLLSTRIQRLSWGSIRRERHMRTLRAPARAVGQKEAA